MGKMQKSKRSYGRDTKILAAALLAGVSACATSQGPVSAYALTRTSGEAPGGNCPNGGSKIDIGQDKNTNGTLDQDEIKGGVFVCNGPNGALVEANTLPAGDPSCPAGGIEVRSGTDANGNGKLEAGEFERSFSCNGPGDAKAKN